MADCPEVNSQNQKIKRARSTNFSCSEISLLVAEYGKVKSTLEGSKVPNSVKNKIWEAIAQKVSEAGTALRTSKEIKTKWANLSRVSKHTHTAYKQSFMQTGGGPPLDSPKGFIKEIINQNSESEQFTGIDGGMEAGIDFGLFTDSAVVSNDEGLVDSETIIDEGNKLTVLEDIEILHPINVNVDIVQKEDVTSSHLGSAFNQWQKPVTEFGRSDPKWVVNLKASRYVGEIDFGRREWARARDAVDAVMDLLLKEMRARAGSYECLRIDSYIRQGSSRDGLKVIKPDEFDTVIEFHIEGLSYLQKPILKNGRLVPGFCYLQVQQSSPESLMTRYPKLWRENVFQVDQQNNVYLSSRMLHQGVFESIIDQSIRAITLKVDAMKQSQNVNFHITRRMNPPAVNITIHLDDDAKELFMRQGKIRNPSDVHDIDLDIVPAIRLKIDTDTKFDGSPMNAVIHAVCKWKEEEATTSLEFVDQMLVWHINSAGYERYILDVARKSQKQKYILTALRILKTYFTKTNIMAKQENRPPPPITTVLKSYHLKQIAFYLILYACHVHPYIQIDDAQRALVCFIDLLGVSLEKKHLPHFFYSNSLIMSMIPNFPIERGTLRFDLFRKIPAESLRQAKLSLDNHVTSDLGFSSGGNNPDQQKLISCLTQEIDRGDYF